MSTVIVSEEVSVPDSVVDLEDSAPGEAAPVGNDPLYSAASSSSSAARLGWVWTSMNSSCDDSFKEL